MSAEQMTFCVWETEVTPAGDNRATVVARRPLHRLSVGQAGKILGCGKDAVWRAYRAGLITGWKPGARKLRVDGKKSNATIVLDAESVLKYRESVTQHGIF